MIKQLTPIPNILGGILFAFIAILGIRVTYPIVDAIMSIWDAGIMKTVGILVYLLIYVFVLWVFVWMKFFAPNIDKVNQKMGGGT